MARGPEETLVQVQFGQFTPPFRQFTPRFMMEVSPGRNGYECNPVIYCMAVERAPPGTRVATILRYKVEVRSRHGWRTDLTLIARSSQPAARMHNSHQCPAHHAPRLDASRRTPGALHPEPEFNVSDHFADELLFYFLIAREHDDAYHCRRSLSAGPWTWSQANCSR